MSQEENEQQPIKGTSTVKPKLKQTTEEEKQKNKEARKRYREKNKDVINAKNREYFRSLSQSKKQQRAEYNNQLFQYYIACTHMLEKFFPNMNLVMTEDVIQEAKTLLTAKPYLNNIRLSQVESNILSTDEVPKTSNP